MIKNNFLKQGIGIAEKIQEKGRDRWGGNVNHKSLFDFLAFFQRSLLFNSFIFIILVCMLFLYPFVD